MDEKLQSFSFSTTEAKKFKLPPGATLIEERCDTRVEKIMNGYLLRKSYDIKYQDANGNNQWAYPSETWFSKDNPVKINLKEKSLADKLE